MGRKRIEILLVEDNQGDARLMRDMLTDVRRARFDVECVDRLSIGLQRLGAGAIDVVLLDVNLPDSQGLDAVTKVRAQSPNTPVVVLTGLIDEQLAIEAARNGAQDYLIKGEVTGELVARALLYAIERHRLQAELRSLSLTDELTGLDNRRGFLTAAKQQLKLVPRTHAGISLLIADLDGLKQINDTFGHSEGDRALVDTANVLKATFRKPDIVARLGGDEFAVLAIGTSPASAEIFKARLRENLKARNAEPKRTYGLSLSVGAAHCDPESNFSVQALVAKADEALYVDKRRKRRALSTVRG